MSSTRLWVKRGEDGLSLISSSPPLLFYDVVAGVGDPGISAVFLPTMAEITDPGYSLREHANARVSNSANHCCDRYQRDITLQERDEQKCYYRYADGHPVHQGSGN